MSSAYRANLPVGFANAGFDLSQAAATFRSLVDTFARSCRFDQILDRLAEEFATSRRPALSGCLLEYAGDTAISVESELAPRENLLYQLRRNNESLVLLFGSTEITFPGFVHEAVSFALRGPPFIVRDLPGGLNEDAKIVLARRLIKEGLLDFQAEI